MAGAGVTADLGTLETIDRRLLHVFVAGPGEGEGIAVALPGAGWVLVDGCRAVCQGRDDSYPLERIVARYGDRDDTVRLVVFTHPHRDHAHGLAELLERIPVERVALTGLGTTRRTLIDEAAALEARRARESTGAAIRTGVVLRALRAIDSWSEEPGHEVVPMHDGATLLTTSVVTVRARAPDEAWLSTWMADGTLAERMVRNANSLSGVLELGFGKTIVLLGGDLPVRDHDGIVPTGWRQVIERHGHLVWHHGLKVPHHGSRDALHSDLIAHRRHDRAWCLTPFNSSSLPRTDAEDGLDMLLSGQSPVLLTAMSLSRRLQVARDDGRVTPATLGRQTRMLREGGSFTPDDTTWRTASSLGPLDAVWCVAFDDAGAVAGRWRGAAALEVFAPE